MFKGEKYRDGIVQNLSENITVQVLSWSQDWQDWHIQTHLIFIIVRVGNCLSLLMLENHHLKQFVYIQFVHSALCKWCKL